GRQKRGEDRSAPAVFEPPRELAGERRHSRLVEIDRQGREPRSDERQREPRAAALGQRPGDRDDLAAWQGRGEVTRILRRRVRRQERDLRSEERRVGKEWRCR